MEACRHCDAMNHGVLFSREFLEALDQILKNAIVFSRRHWLTLVGGVLGLIGARRQPVPDMRFTDWLVF
jgi:hypothetical protein